MSRKIIIGLLIFIFLFGIGYIIMLFNQPQEFDWNQNYSKFSKQPFGKYVFYDQLPHFFPEKDVRTLYQKDMQSYYDILRLNNNDVSAEINAYLEESFENQYSEEIDSKIDSAFLFWEMADTSLMHFNYFKLANTIEDPKEDLSAILLFVHNGGNAFLSANNFSQNIQDFLGFNLNTYVVSESSKDSELAKTIRYKEEPSVTFKKIERYSAFTKKDKNTHTIARNGLNQIVGVQIPYGKGHLTIFTVPEVFNNYEILKTDRTLVKDLIQELPMADTYYSLGLESYTRSKNKSVKNRNILDFIHKNPSLSWAFYTLLFTLLLFYGFQIKRTQRRIKIIQPPENDSLKFATVVSQLYQVKKNKKELVGIKMRFFLEQIREHYQLDTNNINATFFQILATKSNNTKDNIETLFQFYNTLISQENVSDVEFYRFNKLIENFYKNGNRRKQS